MTDTRYNLRLALLAMAILAGLALQHGADHRLAKHCTHCAEAAARAT